jgi:hypothetical protein
MAKRNQSRKTAVPFPYFSEVVDKLVERIEQGTLTMTEADIAVAIVKNHWKHPKDKGYNDDSVVNEKANLLCDAMVGAFNLEGEDEDQCLCLDGMVLANKFFAYLETPLSMRDF